ncbi:MAG TPA: HD domain-containing phosphohydrolase [Candidatus Dormibacteraeota bacterium]|nr:HD domain-containing phosphohydrolase [Candidatus Dormibacteraeota bacterium]
MSEPHVESLFVTPSVRRRVVLGEFRRNVPWQRPIRQQIIVPFFLLLILVTVLGGAALTYQATGAGMAGFDQNLVRVSVQANDSLASLEAARLNDLRALAATPGLSIAVEAGNPELSALLAPDAKSALDAHIVIRILDANGKRLASIPDRSAAAAYERLPAIRQVLRGWNDGRGDKFVALVRESSGPFVQWAAPIRDTSHHVIGAALLGVSVDTIATAIRPSQSAAVFFYDPTGAPIETLNGGLSSLSDDVRRSVSADHLVRLSATANGHAYAVALSEWTMRGERIGYLGIGLPADGVVANVLQLRVVLLLAFVGTALLVLLVGGLLARRIARPLEDLVSSMSMVAAADLGRRGSAGHADEIGYLASSFSQMTASLNEKTKAVEAISFASVEALARAIDARDSYTYGHSARVARLSVEIAGEMGLPAEQVLALGRASLLHDIGKIGVEDRVLRKPGPLNEWERAAMRQHPVIGYEMLKDLHFLQPSLTGVRHHHEHWNGTGYPDGLKGEDIPLPVRILTVADALDALTSDRPYRSAKSFSAAMRAIDTGVGTQFDPAVVHALRSRSEVIAALLNAMDRFRAAPLGGLEVPAI